MKTYELSLIQIKFGDGSCSTFENDLGYIVKVLEEILKIFSFLQKKSLPISLTDLRINKNSWSEWQDSNLSSKSTIR